MAPSANNSNLKFLKEIYIKNNFTSLHPQIYNGSYGTQKIYLDNLTYDRHHTTCKTNSQR